MRHQPAPDRSSPPMSRRPTSASGQSTATAATTRLDRSSCHQCGPAAAHGELTQHADPRICIILTRQAAFSVCGEGAGVVASGVSPGSGVSGTPGTSGMIVGTSLTGFGGIHYAGHVGHVDDCRRCRWRRQVEQAVRWRWQQHRRPPPQPEAEATVATSFFLLSVIICPFGQPTWLCSQSGRQTLRER